MGRPISSNGWMLDRQDRATYCASHRTRLGGGTITRVSASKWYAESDDTGDIAVCPTLTKAFLWVQHQSEIASR
jgi:hypothetical protein